MLAVDVRVDMVAHLLLAVLRVEAVPSLLRAVLKRAICVVHDAAGISLTVLEGVRRGEVVADLVRVRVPRLEAVPRKARAGVTADDAHVREPNVTRAFEAVVQNVPESLLAGLAPRLELAELRVRVIVAGIDAGLATLVPIRGAGLRLHDEDVGHREHNVQLRVVDAVGVRVKLLQVGQHVGGIRAEALVQLGAEAHAHVEPVRTRIAGVAVLPQRDEGERIVIEDAVPVLMVVVVVLMAVVVVVLVVVATKAPVAARIVVNAAPPALDRAGRRFDDLQRPSTVCRVHPQDLAFVVNDCVQTLRAHREASPVVPERRHSVLVGVLNDQPLLRVAAHGGAVRQVAQLLGQVKVYEVLARLEAEAH